MLQTAFNARYPNIDPRNPNRINTAENAPLGAPPTSNNMYFSTDVPGAHIVHISSYIQGEDVPAAQIASKQGDFAPHNLPLTKHLDGRVLDLPSCGQKPRLDTRIFR